VQVTIGQYAPKLNLSNNF